MSVIATTDGTGLVALTLMVLLSMTHLIGLVPACASSRVEPNLHNALNAGSVRVIVELRLDRPFAPEGSLPDAAAIAAQRQTISLAQQRVLSALGGTQFSITRRYTTTPFLALVIGRDALGVLERRDDLVTRVIEDTQAAPTTPLGPSSPAQ